MCVTSVVILFWSRDSNNNGYVSNYLDLSSQLNSLAKSSQNSNVIVFIALKINSLVILFIVHIQDFSDVEGDIT